MKKIKMNEDEDLKFNVEPHTFTSYISTSFINNLNTLLLTLTLVQSTGAVVLRLYWTMKTSSPIGRTTKLPQPTCAPALSGGTARAGPSPNPSS